MSLVSDSCGKYDINESRDWESSFAPQIIKSADHRRPIKMETATRIIRPIPQTSQVGLLDASRPLSNRSEGWKATVQPVQQIQYSAGRQIRCGSHRLGTGWAGDSQATGGV